MCFWVILSNLDFSAEIEIEQMVFCLFLGKWGMVIYIMMVNSSLCREEEWENHWSSGIWLCLCNPEEGLSSFLRSSLVGLRMSICVSWLDVQWQVLPFFHVYEALSFKPWSVGTGGVDAFLWIRVGQSWRFEAAFVDFPFNNQ